MNDCPSVTEVLSPWADFSNVPPDRLEQAAERGTRVHELCAAHAKGFYIPKIPEDCKGYLESFKTWFRAMVREVLFVEEELKDDIFKFKGHPDAVVKLKHEKGLFLYDIKTPITKNRIWNVQLSAYKWLCEKYLDREIKKCFILQLNPEGKTAKVTYCDQKLEDFNIFLHALSAYRWFKGDNNAQ